MGGEGGGEGGGTLHARIIKFMKFKGGRGAFVHSIPFVRRQGVHGGWVVGGGERVRSSPVPDSRCILSIQLAFGS